MRFDDPPDDQPQNHDEIEAFLDLVWGDHPELQTVGDIRAAWNERRIEMRSNNS